MIGPKNHATVKPSSSSSSVSSRRMNAYSKSRIERCSKSTNLKKNAGKVKSIFVIRAALWAKKLGHWVIYCRMRENTLGKLVVAVNLKAIWFEFWMRGAFATVKIFVFCGWWFLNQFDKMSETHFSCDTVGRELWLAILSSPLCPETDWNTRIAGKASLGCVFIFTEFKSDVLMFHSWHRSVYVMVIGLSGV